MSSRFRSAGLAIVCALAVGAHGAERKLRVCADPDNLPYSNASGQGFENRIAEIVARELDAQLEYAWLPQRRGFVRKSIGEGACDIFIGVPAGFERVLTTRPYYRSSYVFLYRAGEPAPRSFDDPRIKALKVGVQLIGNDLAATPPGHALASAGATANVTGFTVYGEAPAVERMADEIAAHRLDVGVAWGPQAAYFALRESPPLAIRVAQAPAPAEYPFEFSIAMGVRRGDRALRDALEAAIDRRRADIDAILDEYAVPRTDKAGP